jgi:GDP-D-mannose dehydratase
MDAIIGARKDPGFRTSIGDLDAKRDWSWAPSVVSFIIDELEKGTSETITVGSGVLYSTSEIIENFFIFISENIVMLLTQDVLYISFTGKLICRYL